MARTLNTTPRWRTRIRQINSRVDELIMPDADTALDQDEEWCHAVIDGHRRRVRFHDYHEIYRVEGLYEQLFYEQLRCTSPSTVARLLDEALDESDADPTDLTVLDVGAGNGMVGDELNELGVDRIVGIDIIEEARRAAHRDRPGVYDDYLVADLTDLPELVEKRLRGVGFNCLTSVAALGFGDIPRAAFVKATDLIETGGWLAFNVKETFLRERDSTGFSQLIQELSRAEVIQIQSYRRYCHRVSISGERLYYVAMVAKKLRDIPDRLLTD